MDEEFNELEKEFLEAMKESKTIKGISFEAFPVIDLDDVSGKSVYDIEGYIKVKIRKESAIVVLGQDIEFNDTRNLNIPPELKDEFIKLWRKVEDYL